ncbi:hypothetical protein GGH95_002540, partial [Coemansia sp. RSA 1836]
VEIAYVTLNDISGELDAIKQPLSELSTMAGVAEAAKRYYASHMGMASDAEIDIELFTGNELHRTRVTNLGEGIGGLTRFWFQCTPPA